MPREVYSRTQSLKNFAMELGFVAVGVAPAITPPHYHEFLTWLEAGYHGEMAYLSHHGAAREHPRYVLDGVRSVLMVALPYSPVLPPVLPTDAATARYAQGEDYHRRARRLLRALAEQAKRLFPGANTRGVVDTAPLLEREFAQLAGLGWIGKNTMLLHPKLGSWFTAAALLIDVELAYDAPFAADHCGRCTACLDACPTGALLQPRVLDARRCISYWNIEYQGMASEHMRAAIGDWFFGCDICQEVCPWNRKAGDPRAVQASGTNTTGSVALIELFRLSEEAFRELFRPTSLWRAKRRGLLRNAAIVLANHRDTSALPELTASTRDPDEVVRSAAAWAAAQIRGTAAPAT